MSKRKPSALVALLLIALASVQLACGLTQDVSKQATTQALAEWLAPTATAASFNNADYLEALQTAAVEATQQGSAIAATRTAQALSAESQAATEAAFGPLLDELPKYGVNPAAGRPGWVHPPVTLELEGYQQYDSKNNFIFTIVEDFAISADITWNTQYGTSGCGFILRSDGDEEEPNQYMVMATRGSMGHVLFTIMSEGEFVGGKDIYARGADPEFDWENDGTNRLTVVGRGTEFQIYTNGTLIGEVDAADPPTQPALPPRPTPPDNLSDPGAFQAYQDALEDYEDQVDEIERQFQAQRRSSGDANTVFERGFAALAAMSESGRTVCQFDNAWLWVIEELQ
jgi:hypothetical protein